MSFALDSNGNSALHIACIKGSKHTVKEIVFRCKPNLIELKNNDGNTPLHLLCIYGFGNLVKELCDIHIIRSETMMIQDNHNNTPLHLACINKRLNVIRELDKGGLVTDSAITTKNDEGDTPAHIACREGLTEVVIIIIRCQNPNYEKEPKDKLGNTPLACAYVGGHLDTALVMINSGANYNTRDTLNNNTLLHTACIGNYIGLVRLILELNSDTNEKNGREETPLHILRPGQLDIAKLLFDKGANINAKDNEKNTPLLRLCLVNAEEIVDFLVSVDASVNDENKKGYTPLYIACERNFFGIVKTLVNKGISNLSDMQRSVNTACEKGYLDIVSFLAKNGASLSEADSNGESPMSIACKNKNTKLLKLLIRNKVDINKDIDIMGNTPLHKVCETDSLRMGKILIKNGADIHKVNNNLDTPLHTASFDGSANMVKHIISIRSVFSDMNKDRMTPLHCACFSGSVIVVKLLILHSKNECTKVNKYGDTVIHLACQNKDTKVIKFICNLFHSELLLPNDDIRNYSGRTPLHYAAICDNVKSVKYLKGITIDALDENCLTPLYMAFEGNSLNMIKLLIKKGSDINICNGDKSMLHLSVRNSCLESTRLLISKGINLEARSSGKTPLHISCSDRDPNMAWELLSSGANPNAKDNEGNTPLHIASMLGNFDIVVTLILKGANTSETNIKGVTPKVFFRVEILNLLKVRLQRYPTISK